MEWGGSCRDGVHYVGVVGSCRVDGSFRDGVGHVGVGGIGHVGVG